MKKWGLLLLMLSTQALASKARQQVLNPSGGLGFDLSRSGDEKREREHLFKDFPAIQKWDKKKQETFYSDLKKESLENLQGKYPEVKREDLQTLKEKRK